MHTPREQILQLHNGDCFEILKGLADNSIDAVVTDPPYGLNSKEPDMAEVLKHWLAGDDAPVKGSGFMGKAWDRFVPGPSVWREVFRVLKPGGHLLSFFGSRTYDMGTLAIRLAGFEIRDQIMWVYGSGFPKSLDVSKAIDKMRTEDVEPVRVICRAVRAAMDSLGLKSKDLVAHFDGCHPRLIDHWAARDTDSQPALPTWSQWQTLRDVLSIEASYDAEVWRLNGRKGQASDVWETAEVLGEHQGRTPGFGEHRFYARDTKIRVASEKAKQWEGWGTALKPAHEPICVARKPLAGTVSANVLAHGTGALNIDGCRVSTDEQIKGGSGGLLSHQRDNTEYPGTDWQHSEQGRWPANLVHDGSDEVLAAFPDAKGQQGDLKATGRARPSSGRFGDMAPPTPHKARIDSSKSAARFFYCAKASKADRNYGLSGEDISSAELVGREDGSAGAQSPRAGAGRTTGSKNPHPTVKPVALMRWLVRLVTPPGGRVLDPFMGSGSTGVATALEGFRFTGIELDPQFFAVASERIYFARKEYISEKDRNEQAEGATACAAAEQPPAEV